MTEITFSLLASSQEELTALQSALRPFQEQGRHWVEIRPMSWESARQGLNDIASCYDGTDLSHIGSTWLRGLVDTHVLRPFEQEEIEALGGKGAFLPAAWATTSVAPMPGEWSVPWLLDARIVYYRRDWLEAAGIDEHQAFVSPETFKQTLETLQAGGVAIPLVLPTKESWQLLHVAASWVWQAGGDFVSSDGKRVLFNTPEARKGLKAYFQLARYLAADVQCLGQSASEDIFKEGRAAITICGPALLCDLLNRQPPHLAHIGVASPPGPPFVGGSHLVIWRQNPNPEPALELIEFLTSLPFQKGFRVHQQLPARNEAFESLNIGREFGKYLKRALVNGRTFPSVYLWGLIEEHLFRAFVAMWHDVLSTPTPDLDAILDAHLNPLERRLQMILRKQR
ncbi:MAG: extracellular solute-binding protein [Anaerolineae bacterium]|nr:extracellular solute-binding protein [Anaerolineae bacterium]